MESISPRQSPRILMALLALIVCGGLVWHFAINAGPKPQSEQQALCREMMLQFHRDTTWQVTRIAEVNQIVLIDWQARGFLSNGACDFSGAAPTALRYISIEAAGQPRRFIQGHELGLLAARAETALIQARR